VGMPMPVEGLPYISTNIHELELSPLIWDVAINIKIIKKINVLIIPELIFLLMNIV
jgi:hypothetical protein